jgi:hypothetical protein
MSSEFAINKIFIFYLRDATGRMSIPYFKAEAALKVLHHEFENYFWFIYESIPTNASVGY